MALLPAAEALLRLLDALETGESLSASGAGDLAPLRAAIDAEKPGQFRWTVEDTDAAHDWQVSVRSRARVVDARPILEMGGRPYGLIMETAAEVQDDEVLVVLAPMEPLPLVEALAGMDFGAVAQQVDDGSWRVTFERVPSETDED